MSIIPKPPLSVSIISFNEEDNIRRTLDSIADIAAEIVVVDANSTDHTCRIAREYGAAVYTEPWKGHIRQKTSALSKCTQPWILAIDCDEVVSPELHRSICQKLKSDHRKCYFLNRRSFYLGKLLKYTWQPDWKLRLVHRDSNPRWLGYDPHDVLKSDDPTEKLSGDLIHYSYRDLRDHMERLTAYARIAAESYHRDGKIFHRYNLFVNPVWGFMKKYFLQRSCLDGFPGFFISVSSLIYVFLKYAFLWEIEQNVRRTEAPLKRPWN